MMLFRKCFHLQHCLLEGTKGRKLTKQLFNRNKTQVGNCRPLFLSGLGSSTDRLNDKDNKISDTQTETRHKKIFLLLNKLLEMTWRRYLARKKTFIFKTYVQSSIRQRVKSENKNKTKWAEKHVVLYFAQKQMKGKEMSQNHGW